MAQSASIRLDVPGQIGVKALHVSARMSDFAEHLCRIPVNGVQFVRFYGVIKMRKLSFGPLAALARVVLPALALAAGTAASQAQCTGFTITSSTGASIVPGTTDIGNHDDDLTVTVALPFSVSFFGTSYSTAYVCSNGWLSFASTSGDGYSNDNCLPSTGTAQYDTVPGPVIFPHWDDQRTDAAGSGIFKSTTGVAPNRVFNIEWRSTYFNGGAALGYEVRLFEDNSHIEMIYGTIPQGGSSATVGVQSAAGVFNQFECNQGGLSSGLKLTYTPIASGTVICASGGASPATINIGNGAQTTLLTVTATPTSRGDYWW